jgi:hypothetical protein
LYQPQQLLDREVLSHQPKLIANLIELFQQLLEQLELVLALQVVLHGELVQPEQQVH